MRSSIGALIDLVVAVPSRAQIGRDALPRAGAVTSGEHGGGGVVCPIGMAEECDVGL